MGDINKNTTTLSSDNEVNEVMAGMKTWTKSPPLADDAEYLFPKETHQRRRKAEKTSRLRGLLGRAFGRGEKEEEATDSPSVTGGLPPKGLLPIPRVLVGEDERDQGGRPERGDDWDIDNQLEDLKEAVRAPARANSGDRGRCVPCMVHHTECVYEAGVKNCGGCLRRRERCVLYAEEERAGVELRGVNR